jgi:hypothetical protein
MKFKKRFNIPPKLHELSLTGDYFVSRINLDHTMSILLGLVLTDHPQFESFRDRVRQNNEASFIDGLLDENT